MNFPFVQVAGDTLDMQVTVPDYPSTDGWTLKYRLTPRFSTPTQAPIDITAYRERGRDLSAAKGAGRHRLGARARTAGPGGSRSPARARR
jgi:hypothetical protein